MDACTAVLVATGEHGEVALTVAFDGRSGFPVSCEADRSKGNGPKVRWTGRWSRWRAAGAGILAPSRMDVQWADEDRPWLELKVTSIRLNAEIDKHLAAARGVLAGVAEARAIASSPGSAPQ